MLFDPLWIALTLPGVLFGFVAQQRVRKAFEKWSEVPTAAGLSGAEVAERLLRLGGIHDVGIEEVPGQLSDHYDPSARVVRLSSEVYRGTSVAAAGIAAHETGHVFQHQQGYALMRLRQGLVPLLRLTTPWSVWIIIGGALLQMQGLVWAGILAFATLFLFQVITLPVEFDASARARRLLDENGLLAGEEGRGVSAILNAAGWTYVAAAVSSLLQLLYFILRFTGSSRN